MNRSGERRLPRRPSLTSDAAAPAARAFQLNFASPADGLGAKIAH